MKNYSVWLLALIVGGGAIQVARAGFMAGGSQGAAGNQQVSSAAYRDGSYLGRLAAEQGAAPHVAAGRWAANSDRALFAAAYNQAYSENLNPNLNPNQGAPLDQAELGAFRDGLYLGKLDSELGNARHVAIGRWSRASNRVSFATGYNQAYNGSNEDSSRAAQSRLHLAYLAR